MSGQATPKVGDRAPDFTLPGPDGAPMSLHDLLGKPGRKALVLYFYPRDETAGCTIEACAFRDAYEDFAEASADVVGVSRDSVDSHLRFAAGHKLPFLLLSDSDGVVHQRYGVESHLGGLLRDRISFVIDRQGIVRFVYASPIRFAAHARKALEVVRAMEAPERASGSGLQAPG